MIHVACVTLSAALPPAGVTIVTACNPEGEDIGRTANSFSSVSLDPPMVLWSLAKTSIGQHDFHRAQHFAVHVLGEVQETLSGLFAGKAADRFDGLSLTRGADGIPVINGCAARFECRTVHRYDGRDHVIFVGEVLTVERAPRRPLLFHAGRYGRLQAAD
ncbi:flavin reductase family protein [Salipiger thiooxidans]|uniref:flavin reductase family protein n=1 Tax=Salipiger thiooxidans TaxID=282683 RepID=UPI001CFC06DD|nr:flavin reductase family protein [Salipiger thiooxidans]